MIVAEVTPYMNTFMKREDRPNISNASGESDLLPSMNDLYFTYQFPAIVFISAMMLLGLPGNMIVFYIYFFKWRRSTSRMFILFLAALDMANCAVNLPMEIYIMRYSVMFQNPYLCKLSRYSSYVMNSSSASILVAIAIDRYRRICLPYKKTFSNSQSKYACIGAVMFSIISTWPAYVLYGVRQIKNGHIEINTCLLENRFDETPYPVLFFIYMSTMTLVIFTIITILYYFVGLQIYRHRTFKIRRCTHVEKVVDERSVTRSRSKSNSEESHRMAIGSTGTAKEMLNTTYIPYKDDKYRRSLPDCKKNPEIGLLETNIDDAIDAMRNGTEEKSDVAFLPPCENSLLTRSPSFTVTNSKQLDVEKGRPQQILSETKDRQENIDKSRTKKRRRVRYMLVRSSSTITRSRAAKCSNCITIKVGRSTFMLFLITIAYVVSFLPFYTILLIRQFDTTFLERVLRSKASYMAYFLIVRSYVFSSAVNPFIYSFCNAQFRQHCAKAIKGLFLRRRAMSFEQSRRGQRI